MNRKEIKDICREYRITNYTINDDGSIDVNGNVDLSYISLTKLPLKFRNVSGYFWCDHNELTSLEGGPSSVGGDFYCHNNRLTSLEGCPSSVGGSFYFHNNPIYKELGDIDYKIYIKCINRDNKLSELGI
jgi:hypothetical protein